MIEFLTSSFYNLSAALIIGVWLSALLITFDSFNAKPFTNLDSLTIICMVATALVLVLWVSSVLVLGVHSVLTHQPL